MLLTWSIQKLLFFLIAISGIAWTSVYRPKYGYFILTALVFLRPQDDRPILATLRVPMMVIILLTIGLLMDIHKGKIKLGPVLGLPTLKIYLIFVTIAFFASVFAIIPEVAFSAFKDFRFITAFFVFTLFFMREESDFTIFFLIMLMCGLYFSYLLEFRGNTMIESIAETEFHRLNFLRLNQNFGNPNYLAITMVIMFTISICQFVARRKFLHKAFFLSLCPIYLYTLIKTMSRGGTISLVAACFLLFILPKKRGGGINILLAASAIAAVFIIPAYFPSYVDRLASIFNYTEDLSATKRIEFWSIGLQVIAEHPLLGIGLNNFWIYAMQSPHNSFIQIASETGLIAFFFWLLLIYKGWSYSKKSRLFFGRDMDRHRIMYYTALSIEISLIACMVQSLFTGMGNREILFMLVAFGSAFHLMVNRIKTENVESAPSSERLEKAIAN